MAVDNGVALIGAPHAKRSNGYPYGAVYVYEKSTHGWSEQAIVTPQNGTAGLEFGTAVSIDGDRALVGAPASDSAFLFSHSQSNGWSFVEKLTPDQYKPAANRFGTSVVLDGDTAVVGDPKYSNPANNVGAAFVFTHQYGWSGPSRIQANNAAGGDKFGASVAVDGSTALVGAPDEHPWGSAFVFTNNNGSWRQRVKLPPSTNPPYFDIGERFGCAVALDSGTALVGAKDHDNATGRGYVYTGSGNSWSVQDTLTASNGDKEDQFGYSVAVDGDIALVGARKDEGPSGKDAGAAYVFTRSNGSWTQQAIPTPGIIGDSGDEYGESVALDGSYGLVGAWRDEDPNGKYAGSAYVLTPKVWYEIPFRPRQGGEIEFVAVPQSISMETEEIAAFEWDLDGDEEFETTTEEPEVSHTFEEPGAHTVGLRVLDSTGERTDPTFRTLYARTPVELAVRPDAEESMIDPASEETVTVAVGPTSALERVDRIDTSTVRIGDPGEVKLDGSGRPVGGASPVDEGDFEDGKLRLHVRQSEMGYDGDEAAARLVGLTGDGASVLGSAEVTLDE